MAEETRLWFIIVAVGLGTFLIRLSFILLLERLTEPEWLKRALKLVPAAVMAALISSSLLVQKGQLVINLQNHRLFAGIIAGFVGWRTRSLFWTTFAGLAALWLLNSLI